MCMILGATISIFGGYLIMMSYEVIHDFIKEKKEAIALEEARLRYRDEMEFGRFDK